MGGGVEAVQTASPEPWSPAALATFSSLWTLRTRSIVLQKVNKKHCKFVARFHGKPNGKRYLK